MVELRLIDARPRHVLASEEERAALVRRFGLVAIHRLEATLDLVKDGTTVNATGRLEAEIVQSCAVSGDDLPVTIREPLTLRFVAASADAPTFDEEVELDADELDEIPYPGTAFDLGEAVAQSLALAIDPYAVGPRAEAARKEAGLLDESAAGPFAALAALKGKAE